jgi:secondary thiamine-phosphate synthase enzyme
MQVVHSTLEFSTRGNADIVEITGDIRELLEGSGLTSGLVNVFVPGATGAVTTLEHEPGVCQDFRELFDELAPPGRDYHHNRRQVDSNGHSHVRAALLGPSLTLPFQDGKLVTGTWQQVVFIDFDEVPRKRCLSVTFMGE